MLKVIQSHKSSLDAWEHAGKYPVFTKFSSCLQKLFLHFNKPKCKTFYLLLLQEYQEYHGYM